MNLENLDASKSKSEVITEIMAIGNQIFQSGSVDTEKSEIDAILDKLKKGEITSEQALNSVRGLEQSRQNYH